MSWQRPGVLRRRWEDAVFCTHRALYQWGQAPPRARAGIITLAVLVAVNIVVIAYLSGRPALTEVTPSP